MYVIEVERGEVNIALLEAQLRTLAGSDYMGLSTRPGVVTAYLTKDTSPALFDALRTAMQTHDATQLTPEQAKAIVEKTKLEAARAASTEALNLADYAGQDAPVQQLAAKVAWLEREIRDLRGI